MSELGPTREDDRGSRRLARSQGAPRCAAHRLPGPATAAAVSCAGSLKHARTHHVADAEPTAHQGVRDPLGELADPSKQRRLELWMSSKMLLRLALCASDLGPVIRRADLLQEPYHAVDRVRGM
jgi:hypothetical protein